MNSQTGKKLIREAFHAGSWYSNNRAQLAEELKVNLEKAETQLPSDKKLKALIGPHAGFRFSGPNAAWAYKNVKPGDFDRVFILGPSHKIGFEFIVSTECGEWETPLGNLKVDNKTVEDICQFTKTNPSYFGDIHY